MKRTTLLLVALVALPGAAASVHVPESVWLGELPVVVQEPGLSAVDLYVNGSLAYNVTGVNGTVGFTVAVPDGVLPYRVVWTAAVNGSVAGYVQSIGQTAIMGVLPHTLAEELALLRADTRQARAEAENATIAASAAEAAALGVQAPTDYAKQDTLLNVQKDVQANGDGIETATTLSEAQAQEFDDTVAGLDSSLWPAVGIMALVAVGVAVAVWLLWSRQRDLQDDVRQVMAIQAVAAHRLGVSAADPEVLEVLEGMKPTRPARPKRQKAEPAEAATAPQPASSTDPTGQVATPPMGPPPSSEASQASSAPVGQVAHPPLATPPSGEATLASEAAAPPNGEIAKEAP